MSRFRGFKISILGLDRSERRRGSTMNAAACMFVSFALVISPAPRSLAQTTPSTDPVRMKAAAGGQLKKSTGAASALDQATLEAYVRHLWVLDSKMSIKISDAKPTTELPGFLDVTVEISMGNQAQKVPLMVSEDGAK